MTCLVESLGVLGIFCCFGLFAHVTYWNETGDCCGTCKVCGLCYSSSEFRNEVFCGCCESSKL